MVLCTMWSIIEIMTASTIGYAQQYYWNILYYNVCAKYHTSYVSSFSFYSIVCLLLQTLTVVIPVPLQMVIAILLVQSTQVKYTTIVQWATHYRNQTEGPASLMDSGVDIYLSVIVCFQSLFKAGNEMIATSLLRWDMFFVVRFSWRENYIV